MDKPIATFEGETVVGDVLLQEIKQQTGNGEEIDLYTVKIRRIGAGHVWEAFRSLTADDMEVIGRSMLAPLGYEFGDGEEEGEDDDDTEA